MLDGRFSIPLRRYLWFGVSTILKPHIGWNSPSPTVTATPPSKCIAAASEHSRVGDALPFPPPAALLQQSVEAYPTTYPRSAEHCPRAEDTHLIPVLALPTGESIALPLGAHALAASGSHLISTVQVAIGQPICTSRPPGPSDSTAAF